MIGVLFKSDEWVGNTRPAWLWLGQLGLVILGVHLVADRLDDLLLVALRPLPLPWPRPGMPEVVATWLGVGVELAVALRATWILVSSAGGPEPSRRDWWEKRSVESFVRPAFWASAALCGAWTVGQATEDLLWGVSPTVAAIAGLTAGLLVGWRLGWSGWRRVTGGLFKPKRRTSGLLWAPVLGVITVLGLSALVLPSGWLP